MGSFCFFMVVVSDFGFVSFFGFVLYFNHEMHQTHKKDNLGNLG
jgi:hypothetical protein